MNSIYNQSDIDKINLDTKDPYKTKYQFLIKKRDSAGLKHFYDHEAFMEYSNDMQDVFKNIEEFNLGKKHKVLIVSDDLIADMLINEKLNRIVTELFIRDRKLNTSIVFTRQSFFKVPKDV